MTAGRGHGGWLVLPGVALAAAEILLRPRFGDLPNLFGDFANLAVETLFFFMGAIVSRQPRIEARLTARPLLLLALGLGSFAVYYLGEAAYGPWALGARGIAAWCLVIGLLGLGRRIMRRESAFDRYMGEATLPLYVLHHLPVVGPGLCRGTARPAALGEGGDHLFRLHRRHLRRLSPDRPAFRAAALPLRPEAAPPSGRAGNRTRAAPGYIPRPFPPS